MKLSTENIDYLKIKCRDRWDNDHIIKATLKSVTQNDLKTCAKLDEKIYINTPQQVEMFIITNEGKFSTTTTLKYTEYEDPYMFFVLDKNSNFSFQQSREYFRIKYKDGAIIYYKDGEENKRIVCNTIDISANGVKLELPSRYNIPKNVTLKLIINRREFNISASLVRISNENETPSASFQFVSLKESDIDFISKFCIQKQLEEKRNKL